MSAPGSTQSVGSTPAPGVEAAYGECRRLASSHYENFPVATNLLVPARLRDPIAAIYAFARHADDLADEGDFPADERLRLLDEWQSKLDKAVAGQPEGAVFVALAHTIACYDLPPELFSDLLSAFRQDVVKKEYQNYGEVADYCRRSANPVGRLLLLLFGVDDARSLAESDAICTALQLTNFWQDMTVDLPRGRCYIPQDELHQHGLDFAHLLHLVETHTPPEAKVRKLMAFQVVRVQKLFDAGKPLPKKLPGRLSLYLKTTWLGGNRILELIRRQDYDVFTSRPSLHKHDWLVLASRIFFRL